MMDSTVPCDLPYENVVPDVMVVTMLLLFTPYGGGSSGHVCPGARGLPLGTTSETVYLRQPDRPHGLWRSAARLAMDSARDAQQRGNQRWGSLNSAPSGISNENDRGTLAHAPQLSSPPRISSRHVVLGKLFPTVCLHAHRGRWCKAYCFLHVCSQPARWAGWPASCRTTGPRVFGCDILPAANTRSEWQCSVDVGWRHQLQS